MLLLLTLHPWLLDTSAYHSKISSNYRSQTLRLILGFRRQSIRCSVLQGKSNASASTDRIPELRWKGLLLKLYWWESRNLDTSAVLDQWETGGKTLTKVELWSIVKNLRKSRRFERCIEIYDWMLNQPERFPFSFLDAAILLDLIARVYGVPIAEVCFNNLPEDLKERMICGALLQAYTRAGMKEKAESMFNQMRRKGYVKNSIPYASMMTLYFNFKEYDKVESLALEMIDRKISLNLCCYRIWMASCAYEGSAEKMELVFGRMQLDRHIHPGWISLNMMATLYIRVGQLEKAEGYAKMLEGRMDFSCRADKNALLVLYGKLRKKEALYRVWDTYRSQFPRMHNSGYRAMITALVHMDDIDGAEKVYDEWLSVKSLSDPRIGCHLIYGHVKNGDVDKALNFFNRMVASSIKPNENAWQLCAQGHIKERRISDALTCFKEAYSCAHSELWSPNPYVLSDFLQLCEDENDRKSEEALLDLLRRYGHLDNTKYASVFGDRIMRRHTA